jgi:hypothetical protein
MDVEFGDGISEDIMEGVRAAVQAKLKCQREFELGEGGKDLVSMFFVRLVVALET